jgi:glycosyltransferase involved in cell wall biosynthesis
VTTDPRVSIIIPCYNGRSYLEECLESVLRVADDASCETVVVDDGSSEDIRGVIERFAPLVRYVWQPNQGPAAARNNGVRQTSGEYVRFLDSDDYLLSADALTQQEAVLDRYPDVGLVYGQALRVDAQRRPLGLREPFPSASYVRAGEIEFSELLFRNYITISSAIVRRSVLEQVGLFRTDLFFERGRDIAEDWDLWLRLSQVAAVAYVATPVVAYRFHEQSLMRTLPSAVRARSAVGPWLEIHQRIVEGALSEPRFAARYGSLRPAVDARLLERTAWLAFESQQMGLTRLYAARSAIQALKAGQRQYMTSALRALALSLIPSRLRSPLRRISHEFRAGLRSIRSAL